MLDDVLGRTGEEVEVEDILGEEIRLPAVKVVVGKVIKLTDPTGSRDEILRRRSALRHRIAALEEHPVRYVQVAQRYRSCSSSASAV
jgi:hypothetical protein